MLAMQVTIVGVNLVVVVVPSISLSHLTHVTLQATGDALLPVGGCGVVCIGCNPASTRLFWTVRI
jgi:hypothetical protein